MVAAKDIKILIVDDDFDLLETISTTFRLFKFNVESRSSGNSAIEFLKNNEVNTVISDIRMPDGSGVELLNFAKKRNTSVPKVLFISGYSDYTIKEMYDMGVDGFFAKPFNASAVRDAISRSLLDVNDRWKPVPKGLVSGQINKTYTSTKEAADKKMVLFGRGGLFISLDKNLPDEGTLVKFELKFRDGHPCAELIGVGYVHWLEAGASPASPSGIGIEIIHLDDSCRTAYVSWLKKQIILPFIPMP